MATFQSSFTAVDWIVLGLLTFMVLFIAFGIRCLRHEIQATRRMEAKSTRLKTTEAQRQRWRQGSSSQEFIALLDDIDTLLERSGSNAVATPPETERDSERPSRLQHGVHHQGSWAR
jgi:hypothetical protein